MIYRMLILKQNLYKEKIINRVNNQIDQQQLQIKVIKYKFSFKIYHLLIRILNLNLKKSLKAMNYIKFNN